VTLLNNNNSLVYVNDLPKVTNCDNSMIKIKAILFVDDKSVAVSSPNITELE
jgi:hypothetical protein